MVRLLPKRLPTLRDGTLVKIGVGITVQNREEVSENTISHWRALLPKGAVLVVVDDASAVPYPGADYRFPETVGVALAKNKCFELLEDLGCDEFFLSDNDCYPIHRDWWKPYVESSEPHLSYQFLDLVGPVKLHDIEVLYRDKKHIAYTGQRGCLLYYNKKCLQEVGGFDPVYGRALYEHSDLANRIHASGLTTWRYADVVGSSKLFHSMDEHVQVNRTIPKGEQAVLVGPNARMHNQRRAQGYRAFVPYREPTGTDRDVLITTLLTSNVDPQRGYKWNADPVMIAPWLESVERGGWEGIVLADELDKLPKGYTTEVVQVESSDMNIYHQRWMHIYQYLRDNPNIRWVWCTDGSDVEVLRDPFLHMAPGKLYVGVESKVVDIPWMRKVHPAEVYQKFIRDYAKHTLLNAGVVGGDRLTVQEFARQIVALFNDIKIARFLGTEKGGPEIGDMGAFNKVAYEKYGSRLVYGPEITTEFKAYTDNGVAKFKHK